jgi:hypothetical protein
MSHRNSAIILKVCSKIHYLNGTWYKNKIISRSHRNSAIIAKACSKSNYLNGI